MIEAEEIQFIAKISAQLAHDIRSPLSVMEMILESVEKNNFNTLFMLREAIQSVRDTANNLLNNYHTSDQQNTNGITPIQLEDGNLPRPLLLFSLIESV